MRQRILITGSAGVIGQALRATLQADGAEVVGLDVRAPGAERGDVRDEAAVERALEGCTGVIHLAAVSRVVWGEREPETCWQTNVAGTGAVLSAALKQADPPWVVFGSSREVYGKVETLPVAEEGPLGPVNVYGRSKAEGEKLVTSARERGLRAAILRFSNVYGSTADHADRVVPAFARAAVKGAPLRVHGTGSTFDFTHLDDTVRGILALVRLLSKGGAVPPPIHLASGIPTTLGELAHLVAELASTTATIEKLEPRGFEVSRFVGDPSRARDILGWSARVSLRDGLARLISGFRADSTLGRREVIAS